MTTLGPDEVDAQDTSSRLALAEALADWYRAERRDLPWRRTNDPYRVLVSEIMLQQTRVETVLRFYDRFLESFPTAEALGAASEEEVQATWSGLGYYRRARNLWRAAREVTQRGGFPNTAEGLRELPGIGDYTSAAVASICFSECVPVLDGNVERVLCRFLAFSEDPKRAKSKRLLKESASHLLLSADPGTSNQALMELGATVCRPKTADCQECPLSTDCLARRRGDPLRFPKPKRKRERVEIATATVVVLESSGLLLSQRPSDAAYLAERWELPSVTITEPESPSWLIEQGLEGLYGGSWRLGQEMGRVRHSITFREFEVRLFRATFAEARSRQAQSVAELGRELRWFEPAELASIPTSSLLTKCLELEGSLSPGKPSD